MINLPKIEWKTRTILEKLEASKYYWEPPKNRQRPLQVNKRNPETPQKLAIKIIQLIFNVYVWQFMWTFPSSFTPRQHVIFEVVSRHPRNPFFTLLLLSSTYVWLF